jgi:hypothetical protein
VWPALVAPGDENATTINRTNLKANKANADKHAEGLLALIGRTGGHRGSAERTRYADPTECLVAAQDLNQQPTGQRSLGRMMALDPDSQEELFEAIGAGAGSTRRTCAGNSRRRGLILE